MQANTILVCDDDGSVRELLRVVLGEDYEIGEAVDGIEALELARALEPDLLVIDVMMPRRSGLEVLAELRRDPDLAGMPVIVITAWDNTEEAARAAGADRFLLKPFEPEDLTTAVEELLALR